MNVTKFAELMVNEARMVLNKANVLQCADLPQRLEDLEEDIRATLLALEAEEDSRRRDALVWDLEKYIPARNAAILSVAECYLTEVKHALLGRVLENVKCCVVIVAKCIR